MEPKLKWAWNPKEIDSIGPISGKISSSQLKKVQRKAKKRERQLVSSACKAAKRELFNLGKPVLVKIKIGLLVDRMILSELILQNEIDLYGKSGSLIRWHKNKKQSFEAKESGFYASSKWRELRYKALVINGTKCQCCGSMPPNVVLHVDHIKPRSLRPDLELELNNLQILCEACNLGKMNRDDTDFRCKP